MHAELIYHRITLFGVIIESLLLYASWWRREGCLREKNNRSNLAVYVNVNSSQQITKFLKVRRSVTEVK